MLVTSNIPARQENGECRSIRRLPSPAPRHRLRGLGNQETLETSISSRSALASSMRFTSPLRCATSIRAEFLRPRQLRSHDLSTFRLQKGK